MASKIKFNQKDIDSNKKRTADLGLISYLQLNEFNELIDKYFRDKENNLHCAYSDKVITSRGKKGDLRLEHIIPVSMGGGTILFNCAPSCDEVNNASEKGDSYLFDWWLNSSYYTEDRLDRLVRYMLEAYQITFSKKITFDEVYQETEEYTEELEIIDKNKESYSETKNKNKKEKIKVTRNDYIYYNFLKDCISHLKNKKNYEEIIESLKKSKVFDYLDTYDEYFKILNDYFKEKLKVNPSSILMNCNINDIVLSIPNCNHETFIKTVDERLNKIYLKITKITNDMISLESILLTMDNMPSLLTTDVNNMNDDYFKTLISKLEITKNDKFKCVIELLRQGPIPENKKIEIEYNGEKREIKIGNFSKNIKGRNATITEEQRKQILEIRPDFFEKQIDDTPFDVKFKYMLELLRQGPIPVDKKIEIEYNGEKREIKIGNFASGIKLGNTTITEEQRRQILEIRLDFFEKQRDDTPFDVKFKYMLELLRQGPIPVDKKIEIEYNGEKREIKIGNFAIHIKYHRKITEEQRKQILEIRPDFFDTLYCNMLYDEFKKDSINWFDNVLNNKELYLFLTRIINGEVNLSKKRKEKLAFIDKDLYKRRIV